MTSRIHLGDGSLEYLIDSLRLTYTQDPSIFHLSLLEVEDSDDEIANLATAEQVNISQFEIDDVDEVDNEGMLSLD